METVRDLKKLINRHRKTHISPRCFSPLFLTQAKTGPRNRCLFEPVTMGRSDITSSLATPSKKKEVLLRIAKKSIALVAETIGLFHLVTHLCIPLSTASSLWGTLIASVGALPKYFPHPQFRRAQLCKRFVNVGQDPHDSARPCC